MKHVDDDLLEYYRKKSSCELCGSKCVPCPHHIFTKGFGGGGQLDKALNLISLCYLCHGLVHDGHVPRRDLLDKVAAREGLLPDEVESAIYRLLRTPKDT